MNMHLDIMSNEFNGKYGPYSMNITNNESINSLKDYKLITLSVELTKNDYENIIHNCQDNSKIEIIVQGPIEIMKTRYGFKEDIQDVKLVDGKNNEYKIYKSLSTEELIILNDEEISLINEINYLKSIGYVNFAIDGRWRDKSYTKMIDIYKKALNNEINTNELTKLSPKNTVGNILK